MIMVLLVHNEGAMFGEFPLFRSGEKITGCALKDRFQRAPTGAGHVDGGTHLAHLSRDSKMERIDLNKGNGCI